MRLEVAAADGHIGILIGDVLFVATSDNEHNIVIDSLDVKMPDDTGDNLRPEVSWKNL
jgi:hypothetical protein